MFPTPELTTLIITLQKHYVSLSKNILWHLTCKEKKSFSLDVGKKSGKWRIPGRQ
jgi:hypothetical protein